MEDEISPAGPVGASEQETGELSADPEDDLRPMEVRDAAGSMGPAGVITVHRRRLPAND